MNEAQVHECLPGGDRRLPLDIIHAELKNRTAWMITYPGT